jgi:glycosyltransferase involved in cell wall biosynthesis
MQIWFPTIRAGSGVDVYVCTLTEALQKRGITCRVSWYDRRYEFAPYLLCKEKPPPGTDIIHGNTWSAFAFARKDIPLVVTEHHCVGDPAFRPYKSLAQHIYHQTLVMPFERLSFRRADRVIAVSQATADSLNRVFGITNASVIYNWIDTSRFVPAPPTGADTGTFRLLYVGNQSKRKGWDQVLAIMALLGSGFHLYATSGLRDRESPDTASNITLLGKLDAGELVSRYQSCDALLFPSRYEGFGYVALEAMACGKPVIAANNTALPEVVNAGVTGLLCDPEDTACYVSACRALKQNTGQRITMGTNARNRAVNSFSEDVLVQSYISVYNQLL